MELFVHDLRLALRGLRRRPGFTAAAVLTLALGLGACTAMFSVVRGVLLRPLPYDDPEALAMVWRVKPGLSAGRGSLSQPDLRDMQTSAASFAALAGYSATMLTLTGGDTPELVPAARVTDGLLGVFGEPPILGRDLTAEDNVPDGPERAVIGHSLWHKRLGADPAVVGTTVELSGTPYEIVGVAPPGFDYPEGAQLWRPYYLDIEDCGRDCNLLRGIGRLAPDVSLEAANQELAVLAARLEAAYPETNFEKGFTAIALEDHVVGDVRAALWVLLAGVGMVLLIAAVNVANLVLVRGAGRLRELSIRTALGASRRRLFHALMLENLILAFAGGIVGLGLAHVGLRLLLALAPPDLPRLEEVSIDAAVLAFAAGLVLVVMAVFGVVPAWKVARAPVAALGARRGGGESAAFGKRARWSRNALLATELALSLLLLCGAGLLLRSFAAMSEVDLGFAAERVATFTLSLPGPKYDDPERIVDFYQALEDRLAAQPGVAAVGSVFGSPLGRNAIGGGVEFLDRPPPPPGQGDSELIRVITPGYFDALRIPLLEGRAFARTDRQGGERVAIVSRGFAERYWPKGDALGKQLRIHVEFGFSEDDPRTVVGIVGDVRSAELTEAPEPELYVPQAQVATSFLTVAVRSAPGGPDEGEVVATARAVVRELDPNIPLRWVEPLGAAVERAVGPTRFYMTLLATFAVLAVVLALVGLYGVIAYLVRQRRHEIAIRMALGADAARVLRMVLMEGLAAVALGVALGLAAAFALSKVLGSLLYDVGTRDPATYLAVTLLLVAVATGAILIPARRACALPPTVVLQEE